MRAFQTAITESAKAIIKAAEIIGSEKLLAEKLGMRRQKLNYWKLYALIPYDVAVRTCVITDGKVSVDELRPDLKALTREMKSIFLKQVLQSMQSNCNLFL
jgi:DNA-binding transcriptional regulator YdaS (Cro superfamily)